MVPLPIYQWHLIDVLKAVLHRLEDTFNMSHVLLDISVFVILSKR